MMGENIDITAEELAYVRTLDDLDLKMFLSEINDNGWQYGRKLLATILEVDMSTRRNTN